MFFKFWIYGAKSCIFSWWDATLSIAWVHMTPLSYKYVIGDHYLVLRTCIRIFFFPKKYAISKNTYVQVPFVSFCFVQTRHIRKSYCLRIFEVTSNREGTNIASKKPYSYAFQASELKNFLYHWVEFLVRINGYYSSIWFVQSYRIDILPQVFKHLRTCNVGRL